MFDRGIFLLALLISPWPVGAQVVQFTNKDLWKQSVRSNYSTIHFTGLPHDTFVTGQYAFLGINFTGENLITGPTPLFQDDSWGLFGPAGVRFNFDAPQYTVAVDYPGAVRFQLYNKGSLIFTSSFFQPGGLGNFAGLVSERPFDEVYVYKSISPNIVYIDNLHWGTIPAPGGIALLIVGGVSSSRRRR